MIPYLRIENLQNYTLFHDIYLHSPCMGGHKDMLLMSHCFFPEWASLSFLCSSKFARCIKAWEQNMDLSHVHHDIWNTANQNTEKWLYIQWYYIQNKVNVVVVVWYYIQPSCHGCAARMLHWSCWPLYFLWSGMK